MPKLWSIRFVVIKLVSSMAPSAPAATLRPISTLRSLTHANTPSKPNTVLHYRRNSVLTVSR